MTVRTRIIVAAGAPLLGALFAFARPDYYTSGFYTRGVDEVSFVDQGGVIDPFYIPAREWTLIPRVTLEASGDDNYFLDEKGDEQSSTAINLIPGALLTYGRPGHNHLFADFGVNIPLAQDSEKIEDEPSFMGRVGGVYGTGKTTVSGRAGYKREDSVNTLAGSRLLSENYSTTLGVEHRLSDKTSVGVHGTADFNKYDDDSYQDYQRYYGAGRIYRRLTAKSDIFVQAGAGRDEVDQTSENQTSGARFYDLSVGMRGKPSPKTSVSGSVGYRMRTHDDDQYDDVQSWIASLGADVTPFGLSRFSVELESDIRPDITGDSGSASDQRLTLGVDRRLFTERLRGNASVYFGELNYYGAENRLGSDYWGYSLGIDWWTRRNISFGAGYSYLGRDSTGYSSYNRSYDAGRWFLRMSWNY
jgi:hypothetical protein